MSSSLSSLIHSLVYPFAPPPFEPPSLLYILLTNPVKFLLYTLYHTHNRLRLPPKPFLHPIRLICISDTHDLKPSHIPYGDILIHAGDLTNAGSIPDLQAQIDFLANLPHPIKICIAGNHDTYLDARTRRSLAGADRAGKLDWKGITYLQHDAKTVHIARDADAENHDTTKRLSSSSASPSSSSTRTEKAEKTRHLTIYGAPQIPACGPKDVFAFQYDRGVDAWSNTIPLHTDILVTHTPPKSHLDLPRLDTPAGGLGCEFLAREVRRVKPRIHVFGHVHWGAGVEVVRLDEVSAAFERGMGRERGWTRGVLHLGLWVEVARVVWYGMGKILWERVWGGGADEKVTIMVNAAQMDGNTGVLREGEVKVVQI